MLWVASHISLSVWRYFHGCGAAIIITHRVTNDRKASSVILTEGIMNRHEFIVLCGEARELCIEEITNITCGWLNNVSITRWVVACEAAACGHSSLRWLCHIYRMLQEVRNLEVDCMNESWHGCLHKSLTSRAILKHWPIKKRVK